MGAIEGGFSARLKGEAKAGVNPPPLDHRAALREAQGTAAAAARAAQEAAWLLERGADQLATCEAALSAFAGLDDRVAQWGAGVLRAGGSPARSTMPADLAADRCARADAQQDRDDAAATVALLAADAAAAAAASEQVKATLRAAVDVVVQDVGLGLVSDMRRAEGEARRLRGLLVGLLSGRAAVDPPMDWNIASVAHDAHHAHMLVGTSAGPAWREASAVWHGFRSALAADPAAELPAAAA